MGSYEILWKTSAERDLRNIDVRQIPRIIKAIELLIDNPLPPGYRKLRSSEREYRVRVGNYRVIYQVDTETKIMLICHRREAYRK